MSAITLPPAQPARQAKLNPGPKSEPVSDAAAEPGRFRQMLAHQVKKDAQNQEGQANKAAASEGRTQPVKFPKPEQAVAKTAKAAAEKFKAAAEKPVQAQDALAALAELVPAVSETKPEALKAREEEATEINAAAPVSFSGQPLQATAALPGLPNMPAIRPDVSAQPQNKVPEDVLATAAAASTKGREPGQAMGDKPLALKDRLELAQPALESAQGLELAAASLKTGSKLAAAEEAEPRRDFTKLVAANGAQPAAAPALAPFNPASQAGLDLTRIHAAPGTRDWNEAIGQKVVWMVGAQEQSATLTLNPPDLGPLQVVIHVHHEQADATFVSQNPEVRQALQDGIETLRSMMSSSGIQLGEANISSNGQAQQQFQQTGRSRTADSGAAAGQPMAEPATSGIARAFASAGLVDTFA